MADRGDRDHDDRGERDRDHDRRDRDGSDREGPMETSLASVMSDLFGQAKIQTEHLAEMRIGGGLDACHLEKIARIACQTANETHQQKRQINRLTEMFESFLELYKSVHPAEALALERLEKLRAEMRECCPPDEEPHVICHYEPCERGGGFNGGDGHSMKSSAFVDALPVSEGPHEAWPIHRGTLNDHEILPKVPQGPIVGRIIPVAQTPNVRDFRSGPGPSGGSQAPVTFRTFTNGTITQVVWPPDMSGAKSGDVVLMSGNLWLKLSLDGGKTFTDLDFTKIFAADTTYGGWSGDQVIHYVPAIDCFVLYVQSNSGTGANYSKSVVKVAIASPADLKKFKGLKPAWTRQWNFTSDTFSLGANWLDFPDMSYGDGYLYVNTNFFARSVNSAGKTIDTFGGKLFFELPLPAMKAGTGFSFQFAVITDKLTYSSPMQNIGDTNYWAAHIDNGNMRIYASQGTSANFDWRDRALGANWPTASGSGKVFPEDNEDNIVGAAPDSSDWISEDHRILGSTKVGSVLWFAWTAANGNGGGGGFNFPQPHIQIAKFDVAQDYKFIEQTQVWNANNAFAYPSLTTNSNNEVGISLAWGGGGAYGSHAVGILGDFVVWFGEASDMTSAYLSPTRFGDYVQVRLAQPDTRFFSAFGYAVKKDTTVTPPAEKPDYLYVEFGREAVAPSPIR